MILPHSCPWIVYALFVIFFYRAISAETWKKVDVKLNETFQGIIDTFGKGRDPRFFYTILSARPDDRPFRLNKYSGALEVVPKGFDYDRGPEYRRYELAIQVTSQSDKSMNDSISVAVTVLDVNDKPPCFVNEPKILLANLPTGAMVGSYVYQLNATDPDTSSEIQYSIVDFVARGRFAVDPISGTIRVGRVNGLSNVPGTRYELEVEAKDIHGEINVPQVARTRLTIIVGHVPPQFFEQKMLANFSEKQPNNSLVLTVQAKSFQNQPLTYSMTGSSVAMSSFKLDPSSGEIRASRSLDYDKISEPKHFNFTVIAKEVGSPGLTSSAPLVISLVDINDNSPVFELAHYVLNATREDVPIEQTLFVFKASDRDSGDNGRIAYTLVPDANVAAPLGHADDADYFGVIKQSGELKPATRLDFDRKIGHSYWFRVLATDQGDAALSSDALVRIPVTNVNDEFPEFLVPGNKDSASSGSTGFNTYLMENAPADQGIVVGVVRADDPDGDGVKYAITDFQTKPTQRSAGESPFAIDRNTGYVRQVRALSPGVSAYILNVSAEDDGTCCTEPSQRHTNYTSFVINIQDVNNNRPKLNCSACNGTKIKEGPYMNYTVCQLAATDGDLGDNGVVRYSLRGKDFFSVDPITGAVFVVNANLDRERMDGRYWIYLTGIAEDLGKPRLSDYCSFQITIEDANDNRPMLDIPSEYNFYVESLAPGKFVALLSAIDKDTGPNGQVSFFVDQSSKFFNYFQISSTPENNTGIVKIADGIDETKLRQMAVKGTITLPLILRDHGVPELSTNVSITIQISNGGSELRPIWEDSLLSTAISINESTQPGFVIANLTARVHENVNSPIRYLIPTRDSPLVFTERIPFWFETESSDSRSVRIYLYRPVNAEMKDRYVFTVRATSSQSQLSIDRLINITILDVNDEVPFFLNTDPDNNCYYGSFPENPPAPGILVATAKADDLDTTAPNNVIARYELRFTDEEDKGKFVIDAKTGEIRTNSVDFDFEKKQFYSIRIVAFDGAPSPLNGFSGPNVGETFLRIQILDVNDNPPKFANESIEVTVKELSPRGTLVTRISATDPDQWDVLTYEIMSGDPNGTFIVEEDGIYVNNPLKLNADVVPVYNIVYRAFDNRYWDTINITIRVENVVDEAPVFDQMVYVAQPILENDPTNRFLASVSAKGTEKLEVRYSIAGSESGYFMNTNLNANNEIKLSRPLDHDEMTGGHSTYRINVETYDNEGRQLGLFGSAVLEIPVKDVNDNSPIFLQDSLVGEVKETITEVQTVLRVQAVDADSDLNGEVHYKLTQQSQPARFELDEQTGLLRTVFGAKFDRSSSPILLTVMATDRGSTPLSATDTLTITVVDVNNHAPKCAKLEQNIEMFEDAASDVPIALVEATDNDDSNTKNGMLNFALDQASLQYFSIIASDNIAYLYPIAGSIDYEQLSIAQRSRDPRLEVTVTVSDMGQPTLPEAACRVIVAVRNSNDNQPIFLPATDSVKIKENTPLLSQIYRNFTIRDVDSSSNKFTFRITERSNWRRQFSIAPDSQHSNRPVITVVERLDREMTPEYQLEILAIDDMSPEMTGTATLSIVLLDVNNHPPHLARIDSPPIISERQFIDPSLVVATLKAEDPDTPESNGNAFGFEIDCAVISGVCDMFSLDYDYAQSIARLHVKPNVKPFIRALKPTYQIPIVVWDNAVNGGKSTASLSYRDTLTVVIGGGDYYAHKPSHKEINVLLYTNWLRQANLPWIQVGRPFARDGDDWDLNNKQFKIIKNSNTSIVGFQLETGQIVLQTSTVQQGAYDLSFRITDDKLNVEVVSTVRVNVEILPQGTLSLLHSVRAANIAPFELVGSIESFTPARKKRDVSEEVSSSRLYKFRQMVASILAVSANEVVVVSLNDVEPIPGWRTGGPQPQSTDIFFSVIDGYGGANSKYTREFVASKLLLKKKQIEDYADLEFSALPGDACAPDPLSVCPDSDSCYTVYNIDETSPLLVDANATSFVGVRVSVSASCSGCPASSTRDSLKSCYCIAGRGNCVADSHPSGCACNPPFDGPRCEMTSRSFHWPGGGYAVLPLRPGPTACNSGSFQLEILPNQTATDTILLFLGPSWLLPNSSDCPYLLLEIVSGKPRLTIDLCSASAQGPSVISLGGVGEVLTSGRSFRLVVSWTGASFTMTSPDCVAPCSISAVVPGPARLLTGTYVALLGGKPLPGELRLTTIPALRQSKSVNFSGCLRNLWINNELYDLWLNDVEAAFGRTSAGCSSEMCDTLSKPKSLLKLAATTMDERISNAEKLQCAVSGQCATGPNRSPYCRCKPGYYGTFCENEFLPFSFGENSYMQWELLPNVQLPSSTVELEVSFRSRDPNGILLWLDSAQVLTQQSMSRRRILEPDHIALMISSGRLVARIQLPPMKNEAKTFQSLDSSIVTDGDWHTAYMTVDFMSCSLRLKLDHGEGALNSMIWPLPDVVCSAVTLGPVFLLGTSSYWFAGGRPDAIGFPDLQLDNACLQDIRINGHSLPMSKGDASNDVARLANSNGIAGGCSPTPLPPAPQDCSSVACPALSQCITEWRQISCLCPAGLIPMTSSRTLSECPSVKGVSDPCNWSPVDVGSGSAPCAYGVCVPNTYNNLYSNDSSCQCFAGYYGPRCLPNGGMMIESPERSRSGSDGLQIAAIVVPIVVGLCLVIILVWFICAVSSKRRAKAKAAALGINAAGNMSSVSEAELLADAVLGQSMAPIDNDAAGEEDVDLGAYDLSRLKAAIMEKQRSAVLAVQQQQQQHHQLQQLRDSQTLMTTVANGPRGAVPMPPPYMTVVGDLDRMLAARLAAADVTLEQPSSLAVAKSGIPNATNSSTEDELSLTCTEDGESGTAETNLDLTFLANLGGPYNVLTKQMGVDVS